MATNWTPAQQLAIRLHGKDLLISAAAGSGKTATLTERIIRALTGSIPDGNGNFLPPADISRMLIVTFTRAAAAELRARISAALSAAIAANPENKHLYRQLLALGSADICTIDSFYLQPVRANFERLGLPSSFRLADDGELAPIKQETLRQLIDEGYTRYVPPEAATSTESDPLAVLRGNAFAMAMDDLLSDRDHDKCVTVLLDLYEKLLAYPEGLECLRQGAERKRREADLPFSETAEGKTLCAYLIEQFSSITARITQVCEIFAQDEVAAQFYLPCAQSDYESAAHILLCLQSGRWDQAGDALRAFAPPQLGRPRKQKPGAAALAVKDRRAEWVKEIRSYASYFADDAATRSAHMKQSANTEFILYELLSHYDRRIREIKLQRGIQDFTDIRRALLTLLVDKEGNPTDIALSLRDRYDAVYIDEYQDVDTVQDTIFSTIGAKGNRFMVGDIKQSIYSFRAAEPSIFADYRRRFATVTPDLPTSEGVGECLFMSENFRCDPCVIDLTNAVCSYTFEVCADSIGYCPDDDLRCAKKRNSDQPPVPAQIALFPPVKSTEKKDDKDEGYDENGEAEDDDEDGELAPASIAKTDRPEALYIAAEINRLIHGERLNDGTPIRPRHIAILLRSLKFAAHLNAALAAYGIETTQKAAASIATHPDMIALVNLLSVIDNPRDDVPLTALLSEPACPISLEDLLLLRRADSVCATIPVFDLLVMASGENAASLPVKVPDDLRDRCASFVSLIRSWQSRARSMPVDKLLRKLYGEPFLREKASTPVYLALYDKARHYQNNSFCGLYQFLRYFKRLLDTPGAFGSAGVVQDDHDAVTILTIHKSKGLEFPVVFVANCAANFNRKDLTAAVIFDHELGAAARIYNPTDATQVESTVRQAVAVKLRVRQTEEEMRILYVAMTRARERLYLSASLRGYVENALSKANRPTRGDRAVILSATSYLPWILGALSDANRSPTLSDCYRICTPNTSGVMQEQATESDEQDLPAAQNALREPLEASLESADTDATYYRSILLAHQGYQDPHALLRTLPTKAAASKLRHDLLDRHFLPQQLTPEEQMPVQVEPPEQKNRDEADYIRHRIELLRSNRPPFSDMLRDRHDTNAAERGTATHLFLQYCDHQKLAASGVDAEIERLVKEHYLTESTARLLNRHHLKKFVKSELFAAILDASEVWRELQFNRFLPYRSLTKREELHDALGDASLYVQGSLDLLLVDAQGRLTLCDYKTDRLRMESWGDSLDPNERDCAIARQLREDHGDQLTIYADAVKGMFGKYPDRILIYSLPLGKTVPIELPPRPSI